MYEFTGLPRIIIEELFWLHPLSMLVGVASSITAISGKNLDQAPPLFMALGIVGAFLFTLNCPQYFLISFAVAWVCVVGIWIKGM